MERSHYFFAILISLVLLIPSAYAQEFCPSQKPFYLTTHVGLFQGTFNIKNVDQEDVIPQNIAETIQQKGYNAGLGIGYSKMINQCYLLGAEFSGGWASHNATFQSGAATSAFTDKLAMENYIDLVFVPGIFLTPSLASYLKIGPTWARITNSLNTPTGFTPTFVTNNSSHWTTGFTCSLGLKKWLTPLLSLFAEYNYRDVGTVNLPNFQNFTTTYSHSAHVYGQTVLLGVAYQIA